MGGGYYDRDVGSTGGSSSGFDYSAYTTDADKALGRSHVDPSVLVKGRDLCCANRSPVVVAMDVTGSMGDWSKIIWDKMPMFFGQIMLQGYLKDPAISFCAVGDAYSDQAPIQVCDFGTGSDLDTWLSRLWLEGGGGGQGRESYELAAYFYAHHCTLQRPELPILFITGDEGFYPVLEPSILSKHLGRDKSAQDAESIFRDLAQKFRVYLLHKAYGGDDAAIVEQWKKVLGAEHVLSLKEPKAVVDVMLGVIALLSQSRDLDAYLVDMKGRGQTDSRIAHVQDVLKPVAETTALVRVDTSSALPAPAQIHKREHKSRRL